MMIPTKEAARHIWVRCECNRIDDGDHTPAELDELMDAIMSNPAAFAIALNDEIAKAAARTRDWQRRQEQKDAAKV